jgi:HEAT repeat protein
MRYTYDEDDLEPRREKVTFADALKMLQTDSSDATIATVYYGLSDLSAAQTKQLYPIWNQLSPERRQQLLTRMAEISETNFDLDYRSIGLMSLADTDHKVRLAALSVLWADESLELLAFLNRLALSDPSSEIRSAATTELGRFILLGEYEEIPAANATEAQETAIRIWNNAAEAIAVRRRALEAISNSGNEIVTSAIQAAYQDPNRLMRISAIFAMGRSYDHRWTATVLQELDNPDPEIRYEAIRAAGELELNQAVPKLGGLAVEDEPEMREAAIWSLGEIGGNQALRILTSLADSAEALEDEELLDTIEDAISTASLMGSDFDVNDDDE